MDLDKKVNEVFSGRVVRKDLVRKLKVGANVPIFVLEYLLGKYCATDDERAIEAGLKVINNMLAENFIRPDESQKAQSRVKEKGHYSFIDKIKVRLLVSQDKYWAEAFNFGDKYIHIPEVYIKNEEYERLLEGGIWAQVDMTYNAEEAFRGIIRPFFINKLKPIQLATFNFESFIEGRRKFTTEEWIDLLLRSIGLEPSYFSHRLKLLFLSRFIPLVENNYNLIELGPRGTGKSYVYREISPYSILISGGTTTVPNLFYNMATNKMGLVGFWDVVAFDEVAHVKFTDTSAISILKDYMESGSFSRGKEVLIAKASLVFIGNINQPIEVLTKMGNLFQPLPKDFNDMALIDRFHFYLPGWEIPKMHMKFFTKNYGFVVDYIAEAFKVLRKHNFTELLDKYFSFGSHLNARDAKAVRKTISGFLKLIHPHQEFSKEELEIYLQLALESRRRVKEQLKKMGSFEYYQTSFSYLDKNTQEEFFVGVPEEGGRNLISTDPLAPGCVYTAAYKNGEKVTLHRIEISKLNGTGRLKITGSPDKSMKDSIITAFDYLKSRRIELGIEKDIESYNFHVQIVDLMSSKEGSEGGVAFFVSMLSLLKNRAVQPGLVILGEMTIQGHILPIRSLTEVLQVVKDNGAKKVLIPLESKRFFLKVPEDIVEKVDPIFYSDPLSAGLKSLDLR